MAHLHNIIFLLKDAGFWKEAYSLTLLHPDLAFNKEIGKALVSKLPKSNSHELYGKIIVSPIRRLQFWGGCGFMLSEAAVQITVYNNLYENAKYIVSRGHNPTSSLMHAIEMEKVEIVKLLLEHGADPNTDNGKKAMTIYDAEDEDSDEICEEKFKMPALWLAVDKKNVEIIQSLIKFGAAANCRGFMNKTPLHVAYDNLNIIKILVENGADVNADDFDSDSPLYLATERHCINKDVLDYKRGKILLKLTDSNFDVIEYFVEHGAHVNKHNNMGATPLIQAACSGSFELIKYLINRGADVNARDDDGNSAFFYFLKNSMLFSAEQFLFFLNNGVDIHQRNNKNETSLLRLCTRMENFLGIQYLIQYGADINAVDNDGNTPLINAVRIYSNPDLINYLLEKGADVNARNIKGLTSMDLAIMLHKTNLFKYLLKHGAIQNIP